MSLDVIKEMKEGLEALKQDVAETKSVAETIKAIESRIDEIEATRKKQFEMQNVDDRTVAKVAKRAADMALKSKLLGRDMQSFAEFKEVASVIEKAIAPADVASWIDEKFSSEIIDLMDYDLKIEKLFQSVTVPDGVGTLSFPQKTGRSKAYLINPAQDAIESALTAGKVSFEPVKLKTLVIVADETKNEAVIGALLDVVRQDIAYSLASAIEDALINGDKTGAINASPAATEVSNAFDALRKYSLANSVDNGGGAITVDSIRKAVAQLGVFGVAPKECVLIVNPRVYSQLKNIDDIQTIDKIGNSAVLRTGTVAMLDGMEIIVSDYIPNNLDASGSVDTVTPGTLTTAMVVNTKAFRVGKRNIVEFEQDRNVVNDTMLYTGRVYRDFQKMTVEDTCIAGIINIGD